MLKKFINMSTYRKLVIISVLLLILGSCWGAINAYKMYGLMVNMTNEKNEDLVGAFVTTLDNISKNVR